MAQETLTIRLDDETLATLVGAARALGRSVTDHAAELLARAAEDTAPHRMAVQLAPDFDQARSWPELQGRLSLKGFDLRRRADVLVLHDAQTGQPVCTLTDMNQSEDAITARIGRPFPSVLSRWMVDAAFDSAPERACAPPYHAARG